MGEVIDLQSHKPHLSGIGICTACGHEWAAVAEVGSKVLECPGCSRWFGVWKGPVEPETKWKCNCGEMLFWLTEDGAMCRGCGTISTDWCGA